MPKNIDTKRCASCKEWKPRWLFQIIKYGWNDHGLSATCDNCMNDVDEQIYGKEADALQMELNFDEE